jgi:hypothetical protein
MARDVEGNMDGVFAGSAAVFISLEKLKKNRGKHQSIYTIFGERFEPGTSGIHAGLVTTK